ncbi:Outer membrane efflux protein [Stieleria neptunia]|uniref:Outer membrane efflux protein n=1 Tax=Stieleria neptunia TaxID=2527979 RepID=A0A518HR58_9BACT|nr:TolC family protein [Stieleria neptunia]QDV43281.1 Outer membrane efflux protein [Stieleria neptunia]
MNRSLFRIATHLQLVLAIVLATGCTPTQPFFMNESPDLQHYLNTATSIEYPDVEVASMPETTQSLPPLTVGNHNYEFWNMTLEECVTTALQNAQFLMTTGGNAETRQNIAAQFVSGSPGQFGSVYDVALQQTTTQSIPITTDGNGNRLLPRGAVRANQIGGVEDALAEFDAIVSGFIDSSTTDRPQNVGDGNTINRQFSVAQNTTQQAALSKRLATGGVVTARQQVIYSRNNTELSSISRLFASDYTAIAEVQVQHPLLRNRGTYINRIPVMLASMNEDISIATFEQQIRNLVRDVEVAYWDLYLSYRAVATATIARDSAQATAEFTKLNMDAGTGTIQELSQSVGQYWNLQRRLTAALNGSNLPGDDRFGVYGRERALRELLGLTATDGRLIRPIDEPTQARVEFEWTDSVAQMLYLSPELRSQKYSIKQAELELALAKNQILPDVNLSLLYRFVGLGDTLGPPGGDDSFPAVGSSALAGLTSGDYQEGVVRLEFSMPVGLRRELARIRQTQLTLIQRRTYLQESERLAVSQLSDAIGKSASHFSQLQDAANEWQAAEQEVDARLLEYQKGLSPVNVVLQSQQRRAEAQISYYRALVEYNKSINYVDYLRGTLLANSNIALREGPWNSKAYCDALERARERSAGYELQYGVTRPGVVRRGPVQNADAAVEVMGFSDSSSGALLAPGQADSMGLFEKSYNEVAPVEDVPLEQFGTPSEMLSPEPINPPVMPVPDPSVTAPESAAPMPNAPMPAAPTPGSASQSILVPGQPAGSIAPISYQTERVIERAEAESVDAASGAPIPVRRKAIPQTPHRAAAQSAR